MTPAHEDLFTTIHKGLRAMLYELSTRLQTNDFADLEATRTLVSDLEHDFAVARSAGCAVCILSHHATDEEKHIFASVSPVGGALISTLVAEHHRLTHQELEIGRAAHRLLDEPSARGRIEAGGRLNRAMNALMVDYLAHMNREEAELVPLMQQHFTDGQMAAMRGAIMAGLPPDRMFAILGWMLPSLNVTELSDLLGAVSQGAPPALMDGIRSLCDAKVDPSRWQAVRVRTGI